MSIRARPAANALAAFTRPVTGGSVFLRAATIAFAALAFLVALAPGARAQNAQLSPELLSELEFRSIGPAVIGGRIHDVDALPNDPAVLYVATATGGLWKTTNHGVTWESIFDDQPVSTFGAVEIAPSDPSVIWAGTGEQNNRQSTSWGNGVYRSTDGGRTWTHLGLERTRHIGRIVVHPEDPDIAYVAALGNLWAPSEARGLYRTTDGGESWEKVLYVDTFTGVVDVVMDPSDPGTLYAASYQRQRRAWGFNGGGPGSGIWKTTDGGDSWTELTAGDSDGDAWYANGLPRGDLGRIGLAVARTNPDIVMAIIEHARDEVEGVYRSEDGGESWTRVNRLNPRPMYYSLIRIDPTNADRVYVVAEEVFISQDAGDNFRMLPTRPSYDVGVHSDHHAIWIDPNDPEHFYLAGDGGLHETWDMGQTYRRINNFSIGQFYDIGVDMRDPYWVYGGTQDNHSWMGPSSTRHWLGILNDDWKQIGFGDGVWHAVDPTNARYVYSTRQGGDLIRMDAFTGDRLSISPVEPPDADYRFDWNTPGVVSQHDPSTIYLGGNRLFVSRDRGSSWESTEDLTRQIDRETLEIMGVPGSAPMLSKNDGTSSFSSITAIAESPLTPDVLWVGTDDGNLQVSRDAGETWTNVVGNVPGLPEWPYVRSIAASSGDPGAAYVAFDLHRRGDFRPYLYRTDDFGQSWTPLHGGLPDEGAVNIVVEYPDDPGLIFAGTEHAVFVSNDAGGHWTELGSNLPTTLYDDLVIHPREKDLVAGTHGRGIWILDDLTPLAEWSPTVASAGAHLFPIKPATIFQYWKDTSYRGQAVYMGENPAFGALLSYYLAESDDEAVIAITNEDGQRVRELDVPGEAGVIHRVNWDLRWPDAPYEERDFGGDEGGEIVRTEVELPELPRPTGPFGPFVSPGVYQVTLRANGESSSQTVVVRGDPQMPLTAEQWETREDFLVELLALQRQAWNAEQRAESAGREEVEDRLSDIRDDLYDLARVFNGGGVEQVSLYPPTEQQRRIKRRLEASLGQAVAALNYAAPVGSPE